MRIVKFVPIKSCAAPNGTGAHMSFESGSLYDVYLVQGAVYVCDRNGNVAVHLSQGASFVGGDDGKRISAEFAKKWARPDAAKHSV